MFYLFSISILALLGWGLLTNAIVVALGVTEPWLGFISFFLFAAAMSTYGHKAFRVCSPKGRLVMLLGAILLCMVGIGVRFAAAVALR